MTLSLLFKNVQKTSLKKHLFQVLHKLCLNFLKKDISVKLINLLRSPTTNIFNLKMFKKQSKTNTTGKEAILKKQLNEERADHDKEISGVKAIHEKEISDLIAVYEKKISVYEKEIFEWRSKVRHLNDKISDLQVSNHSTDSESDSYDKKMKDVESGSEQQK
jgi:hypothetical protein